MLEFLTSGLLGSLFGGLFRLAPEVLKFFDKNNDRKHELKMFEIQTAIEKQRGEYRLEERYVDHSVQQLQAVQEAFKEQADTAKASYRWVAALSALVRPVITYVLFGLYVALKLCTMTYAMSMGAGWHEMLQQNWSQDDFAMLNMILTFWFVGRSIEKREK